MATLIHFANKPDRPDKLGEAGRPAGEDVDQRIARLTDLAVTAFHSQGKALRWLHRPRHEFAGASPLEMMETPAGARQVEILLAALIEDRQR